MYQAFVVAGDALDPNTQSVSVFVKLPNGMNKIYQGMYFSAELEGQMISDAIEVPRFVVQNERVYVVVDSVLKAKQVTIEKINPDSYILTGLMENEKLVISTLSGDVEGMHVIEIN